MATAEHTSKNKDKSAACRAGECEGLVGPPGARPHVSL